MKKLVKVGDLIKRVNNISGTMAPGVVDEIIEIQDREFYIEIKTVGYNDMYYTLENFRPTFKTYFKNIIKNSLNSNKLLRHIDLMYIECRL